MGPPGPAGLFGAEVRAALKPPVTQRSRCGSELSAEVMLWLKDLSIVEAVFNRASSDTESLPGQQMTGFSAINTSNHKQRQR